LIEVRLQRLLPVFIASVLAFYVTLLVAQALSDGGQLHPQHYAAVGGVTSIAALLAIMRNRNGRTAEITGGDLNRNNGTENPLITPVPLPDRIGSQHRYLCESCAKPIKSKGWRCESCGATRKSWNLPKGMMSPRARHHGAASPERATYPEGSRELMVYPGRPMPRNRVANFARAMAFVARQSGQPIESAGELLRQLRTDPQLIRGLYWAAAKRLHPDHNNGQHLPEWFELQHAVAIISENPAYASGINLTKERRHQTRE
jgi:hypothetical protein